MLRVDVAVIIDDEQDFSDQVRVHRFQRAFAKLDEPLFFALGFVSHGKGRKEPRAEEEGRQARH
jgi:hypothetical protein